ncbi:NADH-cytochrome b5 reductase 3-like isoform X2 [Rhopilema esculentum]|uniref:NADH-cytochrome b5 reductase 3-like isoform X2 n=1 Tax=Rhopilema esculentum TaxID=499914 RepID=UPI0031D1263F
MSINFAVQISLLSGEIRQLLAQTLGIIIGFSLVGLSLLAFVLRKKKRPVALNPKEKIPFMLVSKEVVSHDTRKFRFALQSPEHILGLPIGKHIYLSAIINGNLVVRPYTPVSSDDDIGYFDLVIKVYFKGVHPRYPDGGKMSQHLDSLNIGDTVDVRGPSGKITYTGPGRLEIKDGTKPLVVRKCSKIGMIAGGTGITPMLQVIRAILKNSYDKTSMWLLFANQTEADILLRSELEQIAAEHGDRFNLWFTLDRPDEGWKYSSGFINQAMIKEHMPPAGPDTQILMCGPPAMVQFACIPNLEKNGFSTDMHFAF